MGGREKEKVYAIIDQGDEETCLNQVLMLD